MVKKISTRNLPQKDVLAFGQNALGKPAIMYGKLVNIYGSEVNVETDGVFLHECTHYISSSDLIKMFKDSKE